MKQNSLKEKLLTRYFQNELFESERMTPLKRFIDSLGLDHNTLTLKQKRKWASTKRYKDFVSLRKIKKIADEANVKESFIFNNINIFLERFETDETENLISESEVLSFLETVEYIHLTEKNKRVLSAPTTKVFRSGRGHYSSAEERKRKIKNMALDLINQGGEVSTSPGTVMVSSKKALHALKPLGQNKIILMKKVSTPKGIRFHRKIYKTPK